VTGGNDGQGGAGIRLVRVYDLATTVCAKTLICNCPSSRCILYWYFLLSSRAVKQPACFKILELYDRTCIYDYTAGGIYRLRNTLLRIAEPLVVMLCSRH
jgi:hypothetical protein